MVRRSSGIRKYKKRRNQPYPKKAKSSSLVDSTTNKSSIPTNEIVAPENSVNSKGRNLNNNTICEIPSKGSRSASLLSVADECNLITSNVSKNNSTLESYQFDTPRKSTEHSSTDEVTIDNHVPVSIPNFNEVDVSHDKDSSRIDCRNPVIDDTSRCHLQRANCVTEKFSFSKENIIKRIPKSFSNSKQNAVNASSNVTNRNITVPMAIDCVDSNSNALSLPGKTIDNLAIYHDNSPQGTDSSSDCDISITHDIECSDDASQSTDVHEVVNNNGTNYRINLSTSYSSHRRYVRHVKQYILSLASLEIQAAVLSDLLNDSDMKEVIIAAGVKSPEESKFNDHIVSQVLKQINRSSAKNSTRGRVNNDKQSFKINLTAAMVRSPNSVVSHSVSNKKMIHMLHNKTSMSRSSARRLVIKANQRRIKLTNGEKDTTWSIICHRTKYNTQQNSMSKALFEWMINHPHVVSSPIFKDTVIVKVPTSNGQVQKERVGKLLLEISIRELHQDLLKPPPIGLADVYFKQSKKCLISESYLRNIIPPQLRPITFSQKQLCGCETCTVMKLLHSSLVKYRKKLLQAYDSQPRSVTRSRRSHTDPLATYCDSLKNQEFLLSNDISSIINNMTCTSVDNNGLLQWNCAMNRCNRCPDHQPPLSETIPNASFEKINFCTYEFHSKCKLHGLLPPNTSSCQKCQDAISRGVISIPDKLSKRKEITSLDTSIHKFHTDIYTPMLKNIDIIWLS